MILLSPAPAQGRPTGTKPFVRPLRSMSDALSRGVWQVYAELDRRRVRLLDDPLSVVDASSRLRGIPVVRVSPPSERRGTRVLPSAPRDSTSSSTWAAPMRWTPIRATSSRSIAPFPSWPRSAHGRFASETPPPSEAGRRTSTRSSQRNRSAPSPWNDSPILRTGGLTLATAAFPTDGGSVTRNRVQPLYGSTHLVIQKLRELHDVGWERVARSAVAWPQAPIRRGANTIQACSNLRAGWALGWCGRWHFGSR